MSDDKIIPFPKNRIVNQRSRELDEQRRKMSSKAAKEIEKQQTKHIYAHEKYNIISKLKG